MYAERVTHTKPRPGCLAEPEATRVGPPTPTEFMCHAADAFGVTPNQLVSHDRHLPLAQIRHVVIAACHQVCGVSYLTLADVFDRHESTIKYACERGAASPWMADLLSTLRGGPGALGTPRPVTDPYLEEADNGGE